ncbi:MAG: nucleotidyltransferase domain-containing protein [Thermoflexales bacterium]
MEVFGSALTGLFLPASSDIDFLVRFEALPVRDYAENFFSLKDGLEALFGRTVDLVESEPLRNPYFIEQIRSSRSPLYGA